MANVEIARVRELLEGLVAERGSPITGARVRTARNSKGKLVTCRWALESGPRSPAVTFDYGQVVIEDRWVVVKAAISRLVSLIRKEGIQSAHWERRMAHHHKYTPWPEWYLELRPEDHKDGLNRFEYSPSVRFGLPPFDSPGDAIAALIWPEMQWSGGSPPHSVEIIVTLPDTRGRIRSVAWQARTLVVELDGACLAACELQVVPSQDKTRSTMMRVREVEAAVRLEVPDGASRVELFLVHSSGELLHKRTVTAGNDLREPADRLSAEQRADMDRLNGENDTVEFKPFIDRGSAKEAELVETAVAFANTDGGVIYLGIRDKGGALEGARGLQSVAKGLQQENLDAYRGSIETYLRDAIRPVPTLNAHFVQIRGEPVLAIQIEKGTSAPYATHDHDVYVRKGSTNRKPDPQTELRQLLDAGNGAARVIGGLFGLSSFE